MACQCSETPFTPVEGSGDEYELSAEAGTLWENPRRHELLDWTNDYRPDNKETDSGGQQSRSSVEKNKGWGPYRRASNLWQCGHHVALLCRHRPFAKEARSVGQRQEQREPFLPQTFCGVPYP